VQATRGSGLQRMHLRASGEQLQSADGVHHPQPPDEPGHNLGAIGEAAIGDNVTSTSVRCPKASKSVFNRLSRSPTEMTSPGRWGRKIRMSSAQMRFSCAVTNDTKAQPS
jgi:hypothetical protein